MDKSNEKLPRGFGRIKIIIIWSVARNAIGRIMLWQLLKEFAAGAGLMRM